MEDLEMQIRKEIYRAASLLGAKSDLLGVIGSWGDTLPDADILQHLKDWNEGESSLSSPPPKEK